MTKKDTEIELIKNMEKESGLKDKEIKFVKREIPIEPKPKGRKKKEVTVKLDEIRKLPICDYVDNAIKNLENATILKNYKKMEKVDLTAPILYSLFYKYPHIPLDHPLVVLLCALGIHTIALMNCLSKPIESSKT